MASHFWEKRLFGKTFSTSVLTIAREMPQTKEKNPGKIYVFIWNTKLYIQLHI